jgi:hypothetical protein
MQKEREKETKKVKQNQRHKGRKKEGKRAVAKSAKDRQGIDNEEIGTDVCSMIAMNAVLRHVSPRALVDTAKNPRNTVSAEAL